jgi:hypothetical protein
LGVCGIGDWGVGDRGWDIGDSIFFLVALVHSFLVDRSLLSCLCSLHSLLFFFTKRKGKSKEKRGKGKGEKKGTRRREESEK